MHDSMDVTKNSNYKMKTGIIIVCILVAFALSINCSLSATKWAVLVAGSRGYKNYRHQANVCRAYHILKKGGLKDENIIVFMYDDIAYNESNPYPGALISQEGGPNIYDGVPKDYTGRDVNSKNVYNVLRGNRIGLSGGTLKVVKGGPEDHIFIYFTGHGGENRLRMPEKDDRLTRLGLRSVFKHMYVSKVFKHMVVYAEGCHSGSMFQGGILGGLNIYATTSADASESCFACYYSSVVKACLSDVYSAAWMNDTETYDLRHRTFEEQYLRVRRLVSKAKSRKSSGMRYGSKRIAKKNISEFFGYDIHN